MITAYNESFEKYNIEDGNFELMEEADDTLLTELEKEGVTIYENYYLEEEVVNGKSDSTLRIFKPRNEVDKVCQKQENHKIFSKICFHLSWNSFS